MPLLELEGGAEIMVTGEAGVVGVGGGGEGKAGGGGPVVPVEVSMMQS